MLINNALPKLGKLKPRIDSRTLKLADYLALPPMPAQGGWNDKAISYPMYSNDTVGCWVIAAAAHMVGQWSYYGCGKEALFTDGEVIATYSAVTGYIPGDPSTDNGTDMLTFLKYWRSTGVTGHKIDAFVSVNPKNSEEIKAAIELFGNVYLGVALPVSAQGAKEWIVPDGGPVGDGEPGSWGGHCLSGGTGIPLRDGTERPIANLVGTQQWVYSITRDRKVVPGYAKRIWKSGTKRMIRLHILDEKRTSTTSGPVRSYLDCTPEHLIMLRDGNYAEAGNLDIGTSLMPLNRRIDKDGYERVYDPASSNYLWTHRIVGESLLAAQRGIPVHHINEDKRDNRPENLDPMGWLDHNLLHVRTPERRQKSREAMLKNWASPAYAQKVRAAQSINGTTQAARRAIKGKQGFQKVLASVENHKIEAIEPLDGEHDVYDMEVEEYHNFAVGAGIFVHNCIPAVYYDAQVLPVVTWGAELNMTWDFLKTYAEEAYAVLSLDWLNSQKLSPGKLDMDALNKDLAAL